MLFLAAFYAYEWVPYIPYFVAVFYNVTMGDESCFSLAQIELG